jgi:hypothetical protein
MPRFNPNKWCCKPFDTGTAFCMEPIQSLTPRLFSFILSRIGNNMTGWSTGVFPVTIGFDCALLKPNAFFTAPMK